MKAAKKKKKLFLVPGIELVISCVPGRHCATEVYPHPQGANETETWKCPLCPDNLPDNLWAQGPVLLFICSAGRVASFEVR